ncbi:amidase [Mycolicibacterium baixiangningiae]|uniref:amidase n=1 Tax=Mycolicibacterium baixiangningiae TaxID=2761578 RepID=UPI001867F83E|nr:amidase [Mycolicibacterium baixiangningiae]
MITVRAAGRSIRSGDLSPTELLECSIARMRHVDPEVRAFVAFDEERVRHEAGQLTREAAAGEFRGPLHGIPVAVKDVIDVAGMPTRGGSRASDPTNAAIDAPAVRRLRAAGALILGKTATHEFAHGVVTPPTRNPWNLEHIPGGSSGGSAAAVASGQCLAALGSDTGGSIRVPSALCGVSGLRPARGDIPVDGLIPFSPRLDTCGPIARDAADLALLFEVLSGRGLALRESVRGLRIGVVASADTGGLGDGVDDLLARAAAVLGDAGAAVTPAAVPPFGAWSAPRAVYVLADFLDIHRAAGWYPQRSELYSDEVAGYLRQAERITQAQRAAAAAELERLEQRLLAGMAGLNAIVLPTTPVPAPLVDDCRHDPSAPGRAGVIETLMRLCGPFSWCGFAAATVPCGTVENGLPVGLQIAGRDVATVLSVAAAYQQLTEHHARRPPAMASE